MERFLNKVFCGEALDLIRLVSTASVDAVISDAMYGVSKNCRYDWGLDPAKGDPVKHWEYHEPISTSAFGCFGRAAFLLGGKVPSFASTSPVGLATIACGR